MRRRRVLIDPSHQWPRGVRPVPTPGPLLFLLAEALGQPDLAQAETVLAVTLWSLLDQGFISFGSQTKERLRWWAMRGLWEPLEDVHELDMGREKEGTLPGLDGELLSAFDAIYRRARADEELKQPPIAPFEIRCTVFEVVCTWFGRQRFSSSSHVSKRAKKELTDLGYPRQTMESRGPLSWLLTALMPPKPTEEDIRELRSEVERVLSGWGSFLLDEPGLSEGILEDCRRGLSAMDSPD